MCTVDDLLAKNTGYLDMIEMADTKVDESVSTEYVDIKSKAG